jgi:hypothetical protein
VDRHRRTRNRAAWIDESREGRVLADPAANDADSTDLDDAGLAGVEAGRLGVDHHRVDADQRRGAGGKHDEFSRG